MCQTCVTVAIPQLEKPQGDPLQLLSTALLHYHVNASITGQAFLQQKMHYGVRGADN
jgi:hypothetical protein